VQLCSRIDDIQIKLLQLNQLCSYVPVMRESFLKSAVVLAAVSAPGNGARTAVTVRAALEALIRLVCVPAKLASALRALVCVRCMVAFLKIMMMKLRDVSRHPLDLKYRRD
jgi:hypothetical protein